MEKNYADVKVDKICSAELNSKHKLLHSKESVVNTIYTIIRHAKWSITCYKSFIVNRYLCYILCILFRLL